MHQIQNRPGGVYSTPADPIAGFKGLLLRGGVEKESGGSEGVPAPFFCGSTPMVMTQLWITTT